MLLGKGRAQGGSSTLPSPMSAFPLFESPSPCAASSSQDCVWSLQRGQGRTRTLGWGPTRRGGDRRAEPGSCFQTEELACGRLGSWSPRDTAGHLLGAQAVSGLAGGRCRGLGSCRKGQAMTVQGGEASLCTAIAPHTGRVTERPAVCWVTLQTATTARAGPG